jgi:hypothetical protein
MDARQKIRKGILPVALSAAKGGAPASSAAHSA